MTSNGSPLPRHAMPTPRTSGPATKTVAEFGGLTPTEPFDHEGGTRYMEAVAA